MCGISGIYLLKGKVTAGERRTVRQMSAAISHRGPDSSGFYLDKQVAFGHNRLSIIDLKTGNQPLYNEDRSVVIIFNGEIYNFRELRKLLLDKGHRFRTNSDTEVIVHAYEEYGPSCFTRFNGMFALALWDVKKRSLLLARDRIGIKPLYYYFDGARMVFASEIKAILRDKVIKVQLNYDAVSEYIMYQNILDDKTFFNGIRLLEPGHYLEIGSAGLVKRKYWDIKFDYEEKSPDEWIREFRRVLDKSVKRHLISDVPLGYYLSGGFDSTTIAVTASRHMLGRTHTFTGAYYCSPDVDERPRSRLIARKIGAVLHEKLIDPRDFKRYLYDVIYALDEPKVGSPALAQYLVSQMVAKHVKVVLTGHAGDELFLGYPNHKAMYFKDLLGKNVLNAFKMLKNLRQDEIIPILYLMSAGLLNPDLRFGMQVVFSRDEQRKLLTNAFAVRLRARPEHMVDKVLRGREMYSHAEKLRYLLIRCYLPSLLVVEDKVGMAHSIEARIPFCDNEIVDFCLKIPPDVLMRDNITKYLIKESMKGEIPKVFYGQKKMGFPTPFSRWFRKELKAYISGILFDGRLEKRGLFNMYYVKKIFDEHMAGKNREFKLWSLISIEVWFRIFIDKEKF